MTPRAPRAVAAFLVLLSLIVFARLASPATTPATTGPVAVLGALYPAAEAARLAALFERARVTLLDPARQVAPALAALGISARTVGTIDLPAGDADLIVVGPLAFGRGGESSGPALSAAVRAGIPLLLLEQIRLPPTLTRDLRLWPAYTAPPGTGAVLADGHPVLRGVAAAGGDLLAFASAARPLQPPARGNYRVIAARRAPGVPAGEEGVALLEMAIGDGTLLALQAPLPAAEDRGARLVLANAVAYLLDNRPRGRRTALYGRPEEMPPCLSRLGVRAAMVGPRLDDTEVLIAPGDWRAARQRSAALPPPSAVARFLREGGTIVLLDAQPLATEHVRGLLGVPPRFGPGAADSIAAAMPDLLRGLDREDLTLLEPPRHSGLGLRNSPGPPRVETVWSAPGLSVHRVGQGTLCAVALPEAASCSVPPVSQVLSRLLTGLGVPIEAASGADPADIAPLEE